MERNYTYTAVLFCVKICIREKICQLDIYVDSMGGGVFGYVLPAGGASLPLTSLTHLLCFTALAILFRPIIIPNPGSKTRHPEEIKARGIGE